MYSCWNIHPRYRPSFESLEKSISKLLEKSIVGHYIDLNELYVNINSMNVTDNHHGQKASTNAKGYIRLQSQTFRENNSNESINTISDDSEKCSLNSSVTIPNTSQMCGLQIIVPPDEIQIHSIPKKFIRSTTNEQELSN